MRVTVKDFLRDNPSTTLDLMTPQGFIRLAPDRGQWLLTRNGRNTKLRVTGTKDVVIGSDLLTQIIYKIVPYSIRSYHTETAEITYSCSRILRLRLPRAPISRTLSTSK